MEAESDATAYLASGDTLSNEFALLEAGSVDDDLAKMKAALNAPVENKKLPQTKQVGL
jgi:phage shock protein A